MICTSAQENGEKKFSGFRVHCMGWKRVIKLLSSGWSCGNWPCLAIKSGQTIEPRRPFIESLHENEAYMKALFENVFLLSEWKKKQALRL